MDGIATPRWEGLGGDGGEARDAGYGGTAPAPSPMRACGAFRPLTGWRNCLRAGSAPFDGANASKRKNVIISAVCSSGQGG